MKNITKILSLFLVITLLLSFPVAASAAEPTNVPTIDESKTGSLTIYKYDLTGAEKTACGIPAMYPLAFMTKPG